MDVVLNKDGLIIVPNSDFERQWLVLNFKENYVKTVFLKYGLTQKDLIGLKIKIDKE